MLNVILFHILVDPIRGLDPEIENRKKNRIFSTLTIFLTVYFTLLYHHGELSPMGALPPPRKGPFLEGGGAPNRNIFSCKVRVPFKIT